jgi:hypothetical protein
MAAKFKMAAKTKFVYAKIFHFKIPDKYESS